MSESTNNIDIDKSQSDLQSSASQPNIAANGSSKKSQQLNLRNLRCSNHGMREAVARCQECQSYFCRECITDYKARMLCNSCIEDMGTNRKKEGKGNHILKTLLILILFSTSFFISWIFFLWLGRLLASIPDKFQNIGLL